MSLTMTLARRPSWLGLVLLASLVVNAFLIGAVATDWLSDRGGTKPVHFELRWLEGRLPAADLAKVSAAVDAARPSTEGHIDRLRRLRSELAGLVATDNPDRGAIDRKLDEIRAELDLMLRDVQATAMGALLDLPPDVRRNLATSPAP